MNITIPKKYGFGALALGQLFMCDNSLCVKIDTVQDLDGWHFNAIVIGTGEHLVFDDNDEIAVPFSGTITVE